MSNYRVLFVYLEKVAPIVREKLGTPGEKVAGERLYDSIK